MAQLRAAGQPGPAGHGALAQDLRLLIATADLLKVCYTEPANLYLTQAAARALPCTRCDGLRRTAPVQRGAPGLRRRRVVLSLSGGGYRGLFSAHVLERIHREFGNGDLLEKVDLFAGTSIGAIIATALASGCQPARIKQLLLDHGPAIFPSKWLPGLRQAMGKALYDSAPLRAAIKEAMPQAEQSALGQLQVPLLLPAVNWNSSQLHLLASGALPDRDRLGLTLMDAMLASSAAPPTAHAAAGHVFVDGGLAANAPDLLALQAARQLWGQRPTS